MCTIFKKKENEEKCLSNKKDVSSVPSIIIQILRITKLEDDLEVASPICLE